LATDRKKEMMMTKAKILFAVLGASLALTGCVTEKATKNRTVDSVHQPVVARADYVFDLPSDGGSVYPQDLNRLAGWMETLRLGYGDRISIDPNGNLDAQMVRQAVGTVAARYGLLVDAGSPITAGPIPAGHSRIIVSRMTASVPSCDDWSRTDATDFSNNTSSNFGCATNKNLAAMIANPGDLIQGREGDPTGNAAINSKAIKTYRDKPSTGAGGLKSEGQ
jgi:pilus assembly protein CpaD